MNAPALALPRRLSSSGFSLIEVVLAVGIMALGVVTILGLLPHGMEVSKKTANELAESRIVDTVLSDIQAMDWEDLNVAGTAANGAYVGTLSFNDQGLRILPGADIQDASDMQAYLVDVEIPPPNVYLPTNAQPPQINQNLRRVVVRVAATPLESIDFDNPPAGIPVRTFTQLVANVR